MQELLLENDGSRGGLQPGLQEQNSALSVTEQVMSSDVIDSTSRDVSVRPKDG